MTEIKMVQNLWNLCCLTPLSDISPHFIYNAYALCVYDCVRITDSFELVETFIWSPGKLQPMYFFMLGQNLGVRKALCGKVAMVVAKEICKEG